MSESASKASNKHLSVPHETKINFIIGYVEGLAEGTTNQKMHDALQNLVGHLKQLLPKKEGDAQAPPSSGLSTTSAEIKDL